MNKILTNTVAQSRLKVNIQEKNKNNMKKKTPQVQVKLPGSCNVFYLFFDFY